MTLSSIKAPRMGGRDRPGEPYARESKEFLRQRLIGDGPRPLPPPLPPDVCPAKACGHQFYSIAVTGTWPRQRHTSTWFSERP